MYCLMIFYTFFGTLITLAVYFLLSSVISSLWLEPGILQHFLLEHYQKNLPQMLHFYTQNIEQCLSLLCGTVETITPKHMTLTFHVREEQHSTLISIPYRAHKRLLPVVKWRGDKTRTTYEPNYPILETARRWKGKEANIPFFLRCLCFRVSSLVRENHSARRYDSESKYRWKAFPSAATVRYKWYLFFVL